jgi:hypothetical protein
MSLSDFAILKSLTCNSKTTKSATSDKPDHRHTTARQALEATPLYSLQDLSDNNQPGEN